MLKILGLVIRPSSGSIYIDDSNVFNLSEDEIAEYRFRYIGYSFQEPTFIPHLTVIENILLPLIPWVKPTTIGKFKEKAFKLLRRLGLEGIGHRKPGSLSTGQRKRVDLARALIKNPEILIADEPTTNLDAESAEIIRTILYESVMDGAILIVSTHEDKHLIKNSNMELKILNYK